MLERDIVNQIERLLRKNNIFFIKTSDKYTSGIPDLIVFHKGTFFFEVKRPQGTVQPIQTYVIDKIRKGGGIANIIKNVDDVKKILDIK